MSLNLNKPQEFEKVIAREMSLPMWEYSVSTWHEFEHYGSQWTEPTDLEDWVGLESAKAWLRRVRELGRTAKIVRRRMAGPVEDYNG